METGGWCDRLPSNDVPMRVTVRRADYERPVTGYERESVRLRNAVFASEQPDQGRDATYRRSVDLHREHEVHVVLDNAGDLRRQRRIAALVIRQRCVLLVMPKHNAKLPGRRHPA